MAALSGRDGVGQAINGRPMAVLRKIIHVVAQAPGWRSFCVRPEARTLAIARWAVLLLRSAVRGCFIINPVFLGVGHSTAARNRTRWSGLVKRARKRTIAEGLGSIAAPTRIPLINDHLDRHPAAPDALPALLLESSRGEPPMTALTVDRQRRRDAAPRRWRCILLSLRRPDFQLADFVKFNRL